MIWCHVDGRRLAEAARSLVSLRRARYSFRVTRKVAKKRRTIFTTAQEMYEVAQVIFIAPITMSEMLSNTNKISRHTRGRTKTCEKSNKKNKVRKDTMSRASVAIWPQRPRISSLVVWLWEAVAEGKGAEAVAVRVMVVNCILG